MTRRLGRFEAPRRYNGDRGSVVSEESFQRGRGTIAFRSPLEDFEREELLGEGGMAAVWRARHKATGTHVALKVLRTEGVSDPSWAERFSREARAMTELRHPNIGRVIAFGAGAAELFIALELIEGGTVRELKHAMGGRLPVPVAVEVVAQLLAALEYAHAAGVIHRDIKPGNVMLTREGVVKLVDFGIAKGADDVPLTRTGAIIGTPSFMSPEQAEGDPTDERSDLFAIGLVLSDLITGASPFQAESTAATLMKVLRDEVPLLCEGAGGVPWELERVHSRLVDRERERRPVGADIALDELRPLVQSLRARWPRLLAEAVARPEETGRSVRRANATAEVRRADAIARVYGPHPSAVLAMLEATRIDPELEEAQRRLPPLAAEAGVTLRPGADDDAIQEVLAGLHLQPRQAVLWRRLGDLRRLRGETFEEMIALKRSLRLRRDDEVERRLAQLTLDPEARRLERARREGSDARSGEGTTGSVAHARARRRRALWQAAVAPFFLAGAALVLGLLTGGAAVLLVQEARERPPAAPPPAPRPPAGQAVKLDGLVAELGPSGGTELTISGEAILGGVLEVALEEGFVPGASDRFVVLRADAITGAFEDGALAAARPEGAFVVETTAREVRLVRYERGRRVTRRDAPRLPVRGPAIVALWGAPCAPELAAWRRALPAMPEEALLVHIERRRGDPDADDLGVRPDDVRSTLQLDLDGRRSFLPLGVSGCAVVVVDGEGRPRLRTTSTTPGFPEAVRNAWASLSPPPPILEDLTPTLGERIQRLRPCARDSRCAARAVEAWSAGGQIDAAAVDECLLACDPGAAPVRTVVAEARRALAADDPDRALRLLEPWRGSDVPEIHRALGDAYLKAVRLDEARAHYSRYLELAPHAADADTVRKELGP
jgi:eukaryotic-like serine/threonine-protein kinase